MKNLSFLALTLFAASAPAQHLIAVNQGDSTMSVIDPAAEKQIAVVAEKTPGVHAHEAAVSADGKTVFLPVYGSTGVGKPGIDGHEMLFVDVATGKITGHLDFGYGARPHCAVFDPVSGKLYITSEMNKSVTVIDPKTKRIVGTVPTGQEQSHMLAISHDGKRGYTANVGPGTVSVLDLPGHKTVKVIPVSGEVQRISISKDDKWIFTSDQKKPELVVIDTAAMNVKTRIAMPGLGYGSASTVDGKMLLVALPAQNAVAVIDLAKMSVVKTIPVGGSPQEVLVRPDGKSAYVSCENDAQISVIDLTKWTVSGKIDAGKGVDGLAWAK